MSVTKEDQVDQRKKRLPIYLKWMTGPFTVFFHRTNSEFSALTLARTLQEFYKSIEDIEKCNQNKIKVTFSNHLEANNATRNTLLTAKYGVRLPRNEVEIAGVINDSAIDPLELPKNGFGIFKQPGLFALPILECSKLSRFSPEENRYIITDDIKVIFPGKIIPDYVIISDVKFPVRLFVPKQMVCKHCCTAGHTAKFCYQRLQGHTETSNKMCRSCDVTHQRVESCPVFKSEALRLRNLYLTTCEQNKQSAATVYKSTIGANTNNSNEDPQSSTTSHPTKPAATPRRPAAADGQKKKSTLSKPTQIATNKSSSVNPSAPATISLNHFISSMCDSLDVKQDWRVLITAVMPILQQLWQQIVVKYPLLGVFISP